MMAYTFSDWFCRCSQMPHILKSWADVISSSFDLSYPVAMVALWFCCGYCVICYSLLWLLLFNAKLLCLFLCLFWEYCIICRLLCCCFNHWTWKIYFDFICTAVLLKDDSKHIHPAEVSLSKTPYQTHGCCFLQCLTMTSDLPVPRGPPLCKTHIHPLLHYSNTFCSHPTSEDDNWRVHFFSFQWQLFVIPSAQVNVFVSKNFYIYVG